MPSVTIRLCVMMARDREAAELAYQVRGGPIFDALPQVQNYLRPAVARGNSTDLPVPTRSTTAVFVDLGLIIDYPERWTAIVDLGCPIILDVHFPFGVESQILSIQPGRNDKTRDRQEDAEVQARWSDPERMALARTMMAEATIVTCPRPHWACLIEDLADEVRTLPDVVSPWTGSLYTEALLLAISRAYELKFNARSWLPRLVTRIIRGTGTEARAQRALADKVRKVLENSNIDWEARRDGKE